MLFFIYLEHWQNVLLSTWQKIMFISKKKKKERNKEIPIPWCSSIYVYLKITDFAK